jgi:multiple antibiotic resistance protein
MTGDMCQTEQKSIARRTSLSNLIICCFVYFFGEYFFSLMGITLDAFRIGAGSVLFLNAVSLISGKFKTPETENSDFAVVPLSVPVTIGPGTIGTLLVMGADSKSFATKITDCAGIITAVFAVGMMLYFSGAVERFLGKRNIIILSKLTGLILSALAAQLIFTGILNFFKVSN